MTHLGRMSGLRQTAYCSGPLWLPIPPQTPKPSRDEAAAYGTLAHTWKEKGVIPAGEGLLHRTLQAKVQRLPNGERERWWPGGQHEVRVSWDPRDNSGGLHEKHVPYVFKSPTAAAPYEVRANLTVEWEEYRYLLSGFTGTLDWVGEHEGLPWIDDLKTGKTDNGPPDEFAPLLGYASAWLAANKLRPACYVSLTYFRRYPVGVSRIERVGPVFVGRQTLQDFREAVLTSVEGRGKVDQLATGSHCTYCPTEYTCPARQDR